MWNYRTPYTLLIQSVCMLCMYSVLTHLLAVWTKGIKKVLAFIIAFKCCFHYINHMGHKARSRVLARIAYIFFINIVQHDTWHICGYDIDNTTYYIILVYTVRTPIVDQTLV